MKGLQQILNYRKRLVVPCLTCNREEGNVEPHQLCCERSLGYQFGSLLRPRFDATLERAWLSDIRPIENQQRRTD